MRADELASEGLENKNKTYLQKFLLTIFFVLLSARETKQLCWEAQKRGMRFAVLFENWVDFVQREKKGACDAGEGQQLCQDTLSFGTWPKPWMGQSSHLWWHLSTSASTPLRAQTLDQFSQGSSGDLCSLVFSNCTWLREAGEDRPLPGHRNFK